MVTSSECLSVPTESAETKPVHTTNNSTPVEQSKESFKKRNTKNIEFENELDLLWEKQEETQNAITNQDDVIQTIMRQQKDVELKVANITTASINNMVAIEVEKRFANYIDVVTLVIDKKITEFDAVVNKKIQDVNTRIDKLHSMVQKKQPFNMDTEKVNIIKECKVNEDKMLNECREMCRELHLQHIDQHSDRMEKSINEKLDTLKARLDSFTYPQPPQDSHILKRLENEQKLLHQNVENIKNTLNRTTQFNQSKQMNQQQTQKSDTKQRYIQERERNSNNQNRDPRYDVAIVERNIKLLVCMDSNGKKLNRRKFWTLNGTIYKTTYKIEHVKRVLDLCPDSVIDTILISVGTNDIDSKTGFEAAQDIAAMVETIKEERPNTKIVVSEATPRSQTRDNHIINLNNRLHELLDTKPIGRQY